MGSDNKFVERIDVHRNRVDVNADWIITLNDLLITQLGHSFSTSQDPSNSIPSISDSDIDNLVKFWQLRLGHQLIKRFQIPIARVNTVDLLTDFAEDFKRPGNRNISPHCVLVAGPDMDTELLTRHMADIGALLSNTRRPEPTVLHLPKGEGSSTKNFLNLFRAELDRHLNGMTIINANTLLDQAHPYLKPAINYLTNYLIKYQQEISAAITGTPIPIHDWGYLQPEILEQYLQTPKHN